MSRPGGAALVIALHGSAHPGASVFARQLVRAVEERLGVSGGSVATAWVDARRRTLDAELARGASVVVPGFLTDGYHVSVDIADAVASGGRRAVVTGHVGPYLDEALVDRLRQAGGSGDGVLLAAGGSRREASNDEVRRAAHRLGRRLGVPVEVGFLYFAADASPADALVRLAARGCTDVTAAAYFLAPGQWTDRLASVPDPGGIVRRTTEPIGVHPALVDAIVSLYLDAVGHVRLRRAS